MKIIRMFKQAVVMGLLAATSFQVVASDVSVNMRILLITPKSSSVDAPNFEVAKQILRGFQIPFDVLTLADQEGRLLNNGPLNLEAPDNAGLYYGIILTDQNLTVRTKKTQYSGLTSSQWNQLRSYQRKYNVRSVSLTTEPNSLDGVTLVGAPSDVQDSIILDNSFAALDKSIPANLRVPLRYNWHSMARITNGAAQTAFAYYGNYSAGVGGRPVAGTVYTTPDNREELHMFFSQGVEQWPTFALAPAWISWLTKGNFLGKRRIYLNVHIDDLFLDTDMDTTSKSPYSYKKYRMSAYDLERFADQRTSELLPLTKNSEYRIEYAFNGQGIFENGGYEKDALYKAARKRITDYFWVSHTYTHRDLNKIKFKDADWELSNNIVVSKGLMAGAWQYFSPHSMVTPHISGLFNGQALEAMKKHGIYHIVNDMSVPKQKPAHPHTAYYSTTAVNGADGVLIMPRYPTDIYYQTSIPEEITELFNSIHGGMFKKHLYFEDIFRIENERNVTYLLNYQEAPYMFHQANMRAFNYSGNSDSLVSLWIKRTLTELRNYTKLPVLSVKMDDLADLYLNRMALDRCGYNGRVYYKNGALAKIIVWAKGTCNLSLTTQVADFENETPKVYGPDKTYEMRANGSFAKAFIPVSNTATEGDEKTVKKTFKIIEPKIDAVKNDTESTSTNEETKTE